jgi:hypothetical protein
MHLFKYFNTPFNATWYQVVKVEPVVVLAVKACGAVVTALNDVPGDPSKTESRTPGA